MSVSGSNSDAFYKYILEDKSKYPTSTSKGYVDPNNDFLIGNSGGFLLNYDFKVVDSHLFSEVAQHYEKYNKYTLHSEGTVAYSKFVAREEHRRYYGYTCNCKLYLKDEVAYLTANPAKRDRYLHPLRITGDHYNFLNYTPIMRVDQDSVKEGSNKTAKKDRGFPRFFVSQYWLSKVIEFSINNGFNLVVAKSRRAGFSYFQSSRSANKINLIPRATWVLAAYDKKYVTKTGGLAEFIKNNLEFYESSTPFRRNVKGKGLLKKDIENMVVGYKDKGGNDAGYLGSVISVSFQNNTSAAIGKDAVEINIEELTEAPNLNEFLNVTEPTTRAGALKTGLLFGWGTTGSKVSSWIKFRNWFFNPKMYNAIAFENVWDQDARHTTCGYFKPYWEALEGLNDVGVEAMDKDGNSNYLVAIAMSDAEREAVKKEKSESDYLVHCGQYANTPSEAFFTSSVSMFSSAGLVIHANKVKHDPDLKYYIDGMPVIENGNIIYRSNTYLKSANIPTNPYLESWFRNKEDNEKGCCRLWYHPYVDPETNRIPDIYYILYDPFGKDKLSKDVTLDDSLASIQGWMRPNPYNNVKRHTLVCTYTGRLDSMEEVDRLAYHLCLMYGGNKEMMLPEVNRGETIKNFKAWGALHLIARDPLYSWDNKMKESGSAAYGMVIGSGTTKLDGLEYLKEMLYEVVGVNENGSPIYFYQYINDYPYLEELLKYNFEDNFDRVSCGILHAYMIKSKVFKTKESNKKSNKNDTASIWNRSWY